MRALWAEAADRLTFYLPYLIRYRLPCKERAMATVSFMPASKLAELLQTANKGGEMYVRVASGNRLALGADPMNPTLSIDLSKEAIAPYNESKTKEDQLPPTAASIAKASRKSGDHWIELKGKRLECGSLRELLGHGLRSLEAERPGTLDKLSHIKPRSKRIVARERKALFDAEHPDEHSDQLVNGWWYGTNNSAQETNAWLERACNCAGLTWGKDLRTSL
jgi:hypothetical protein